MLGLVSRRQSGYGEIVNETFHDRSSTMLSRSSHYDPGLIPDELSAVLQDLRLAGAHYCRCEISEPWGIELPSRREATFHFVVDGRCWLVTGTEEPIMLEAGDFVLLPRGGAHQLVAALGARTRRIEELSPERLGDTTYRLHTGGRGRRSLLVCCGVTFQEPAVHPLLELMPPVLVVRARVGHEPTLPSLLNAMADEVSAQRVGAATVMTRLADIIITRVLRVWVESRCGAATGWLAAIRDPQIGKALAAFHRQPRKAWSLPALAAIAHLSRSAFSRRFTNAVGVPPAKYVARWRMHLASGWLRAERLTIAQIAARLGYQSEASFSRTFKRVLGASPSAFRTKPAAAGRAGPTPAR